MPKISIGTDILNDLSKGIQKEWLIANGLGGFASSTVIGCNTRRYHGLLVDTGGMIIERSVLLSKLEESIKIGNKMYHLGTNRYSNNYIHPHGYTHLRKFEQTPFPRFIYTIDDITITKEIFMPWKTSAVIIRYNIFGGSRKFNFIIHPLFAFKNFHTTRQEDREFDTGLVYSNGVLHLNPYPDKMPSLKMSVPQMHFKELKNWYKNFELEKEIERGLDYIEDLFNPGYFYTDSIDGLTMDIVAACEDEIPDKIDHLYQEASERVESLFQLALCSGKDNDEKSLVLAADLHIIHSPQEKNKGTTIVAGYPWFGDWGRDTFISLPGIAMCTGRLEEAREIMQNFAAKCHKGLIPNRFADLGNDAVYNTVDASLWFINAANQYYRHSGDLKFIAQYIFPACESIIENYSNGTLFGIGMDQDFLIKAGEEGFQLTWMDAKVDEDVITPRWGKPVEINALWYNALCIMADFSEKLSKPETQTKEYRVKAEKVKEAFNQKFWNPQEEYLYDVIQYDGGTDNSFRPNQIYAVSLTYPVLEKDRWQSVVNKVFEKLYTPFGLRSLSPDNPAYKGQMKGTIRQRDSAYHQGTAWGFLLGPFIESYMKVNDYSAQSIARAQILMDLWMGDLTRVGQNTLSEVFDGDEPFTSRGCISQAWSIAEALRIKKMIASLQQNLYEMGYAILP